MLVRCLYASRASEPDNDNVFASIVAQSRKNNLPIGVTGLLCMAGGVFIQALEGGRDEVSELYGKIASDTRHRHVRLLSYGEIERRNFAQWSMGKVDIAALNSAVLLKYYRRAELDPFSAPAEATQALLHELVETGAIGSRG
ncbi:MAG: BLUF domain-containing protein [Hyphomonadaceae bacterium]|nr:BLUF domain-containing protein [Hyphomonadaceae bacterium]